MLVALPVVVGAIMAATPAAPAADPPSENASCVAQFVHGDPGPPGLFQSQNHEPMFGEQVSFVAHLDRPACFPGG